MAYVKKYTESLEYGERKKEAFLSVMGVEWHAYKSWYFIVFFNNLVIGPACVHLGYDMCYLSPVV